MERASDEYAGQDRGSAGDPATADVSVAIADPPPSMSAAHWANRDNDTLYRRPGRSAPFRRPPAENSFPETEQQPEHTSSPQQRPAEQRPAPQPADDTSAGPEPAWFTAAEPDRPDHPDRPDGLTAEQAARHWTTIGDEARRPRTSDRDEASAPVRAAPAPEADDPSAPTFGPGATRSWVARRAAGAPPAVPAQGGVAGGPARPKGRAARLPRAAKGGNASNTDLIDTVGLLGPGRDIRPHRAVRPEPGNPGTGTATDPQSPRRRSRFALWATAALSLVVLLGAGVTAVAFFSGTPDGLASVLRSDAGDTDRRTVAAPLQDRTEARFEIVTGTTLVTLRSEDLGNELYRITTAEDSGTVPFPVVDGDQVRLHLTPDGDGAGGAVEIVLSAKVRWTLRSTGGADEQRIDMSRGQIGGIDLVGGARRIELTLPQAAGTVPVRLTGAVDEFVVTAPRTSPVRVQLDSGAKTVTAGSRTLRDVQPGSTLTPKDWKTADRYDVAAAARVTLLSVTPR